MAVKNYLIELGVDADRMSIISYGKGKPEVVRSHPSAWEKSSECHEVVHTLSATTIAYLNDTVHCSFSRILWVQRVMSQDKP